MKKLKFIIQVLLLLAVALVILYGLVSLDLISLFVAIGLLLVYFLLFGLKKPVFKADEKLEVIVEESTENKPLAKKEYSEYTNEDIEIIVGNMPIRLRKNLRLFLIAIISIIIFNVIRNKIEYRELSKKNDIGLAYDSIKSGFAEGKKTLEDSLKIENHKVFLNKLDSLETIMIDSLGCNCPDIVKPTIEGLVNAANDTTQEEGSLSSPLSL
jgi:hypothetical protein